MSSTESKVIRLLKQIAQTEQWAKSQKCTQQLVLSKHLRCWTFSLLNYLQNPLPFILPISLLQQSMVSPLSLSSSPPSSSSLMLKESLLLKSPLTVQRRWYCNKARRVSNTVVPAENIKQTEEEKPLRGRNSAKKKKTSRTPFMEAKERSRTVNNKSNNQVESIPLKIEIVSKVANETNQMNEDSKRIALKKVNKNENRPPRTQVKSNASKQKRSLSPKKSMQKEVFVSESFRKNNDSKNVAANTTSTATSHQKRLSKVDNYSNGDSSIIVGGSNYDERPVADVDHALQHTHYDKKIHDKHHITLFELLETCNVRRLSNSWRDNDEITKECIFASALGKFEQMQSTAMVCGITTPSFQITTIHAQQQQKQRHYSSPEQSFFTKETRNKGHSSGEEFLSQLLNSNYKIDMSLRESLTLENVEKMLQLAYELLFLKRTTTTTTTTTTNSRCNKTKQSTRSKDKKEVGTCWWELEQELEWENEKLFESTSAFSGKASLLCRLLDIVVEHIMETSEKYDLSEKTAFHENTTQLEQEKLHTLAVCVNFVNSILISKEWREYCKLIADMNLEQLHQEQSPAQRRRSKNTQRHNIFKQLTTFDVDLTSLKADITDDNADDSDYDEDTHNETFTNKKSSNRKENRLMKANNNKKRALRLQHYYFQLIDQHFIHPLTELYVAKALVANSQKHVVNSSSVKAKRKPKKKNNNNEMDNNSENKSKQEINLNASSGEEMLHQFLIALLLLFSNDFSKTQKECCDLLKCNNSINNTVNDVNSKSECASTKYENVVNTKMPRSVSTITSNRNTTRYSEKSQKILERLLYGLSVDNKINNNNVKVQFRTNSHLIERSLSFLPQTPTMQMCEHIKKLKAGLIIALLVRMFSSYVPGAFLLQWTQQLSSFSHWLCTQEVFLICENNNFASHFSSAAEKEKNVWNANATSDCFGEVCEHFIDRELASLLKQLYITQRSHNNNLYDQMCTDLFAAAHVYCSPSQLSSDRQRRLLLLIAMKNTHYSKGQCAKRTLEEAGKLSNITSLIIDDNTNKTKQSEQVPCIAHNHNHHTNIENNLIQSEMQHYPPRTMSLRCLFCYTLLLHGYLPDALLSHAVILFQIHNHSLLHTNVIKGSERKEPHKLVNERINVNGGGHKQVTTLHKTISGDVNSNSITHTGNNEINSTLYNSNYRISTIVEMLILLHDSFNSLHKHLTHQVQSSMNTNDQYFTTVDGSTITVNAYKNFSDISSDELLSLIRYNYYNKGKELCSTLVTQCCQLFQFVIKALRQCPLQLSEMLLLESLTQFYDFENYSNVNIESTVSDTTNNSSTSANEFAKVWIASAFNKFETNVLEVGYECATMSLRSTEPTLKNYCPRKKQDQCVISNNNSNDVSMKAIERVNNYSTKNMGNAKCYDEEYRIIEEVEIHPILVSHPQTASNVMEMCSVCLYLAVQSCVELLCSANEINGMANVRTLLTSIFSLVELFSEFSGSCTTNTNTTNKQLTCMLHLTFMFKAIWKRYNEHVNSAMCNSTTSVLPSSAWLPVSWNQANKLIQECALLFLSRIDEHHSLLVNSEGINQLNSYNFFREVNHEGFIDNIQTSLSTKNSKSKKDKRHETGMKSRTANTHDQNVVTAISNDCCCTPLSICAKMQMIVNDLTLTVLSTGVNISTARKTIVLHTNFAKLLDFSAESINGSLHDNKQGRSLLPASRATATPLITSTKTTIAVATPLCTNVHANTKKVQSTSRRKNENVNNSETEIVEGLISQCIGVISLLTQMLSEEWLQQNEIESNVVANSKDDKHQRNNHLNSNNNYTSIMIHEIVAVYLSALKRHMSILLNELGAIRHIELSQEVNSNVNSVESAYSINRMRRVIHVFLSAMKLLSAINHHFPFTVHYSSSALFMFKREIILPAITLLMEHAKSNTTCTNIYNNNKSDNIHVHDNDNIIICQKTKSKRNNKTQAIHNTHIKEENESDDKANDANSTEIKDSNTHLRSFLLEELTNMMSMICDDEIMHQVAESVFTQILMEVKQCLENTLHEQTKNATFNRTASLQTITLCTLNVLSRHCASLDTLCYDLLKILLPYVESGAKLLIIVTNKLCSLHVCLPTKLEQLIVTNLLVYTEHCYQSYIHLQENTFALQKTIREKQEDKHETLPLCIASLHATSRCILFTASHREKHDKETEQKLISLVRLSNNVIECIATIPLLRLPLEVWIQLLETTINLSICASKAIHRTRHHNNVVSEQKAENSNINESSFLNACKTISEFAFAFARCMFSHSISHLPITTLEADNNMKRRTKQTEEEQQQQQQQSSSLSLAIVGENGGGSSINGRVFTNKNNTNKGAKNSNINSERLLVQFVSAKSDEIGQLMQRATPEQLVKLIKTFTLLGHTNKRAKEIVRRLINPLLTCISNQHESNSYSGNTIHENYKSSVNDNHSNNNAKMNSVGKMHSTSTRSLVTNTYTANKNTEVYNLLSPSDILTCVESYVEMHVAHPYLYSVLFSKLADYNHFHKEFTSVFTLSLPHSIRLLQCGWRINKILSSQSNVTSTTTIVQHQQEEEIDKRIGTGTLSTSHMHNENSSNCNKQYSKSELVQSTHSTNNNITNIDKNANAHIDKLENVHKESESLWRIIQTSCLATATPIFVAHIQHILKSNPLLLYAVQSVSPTLLHCLASLHNHQNMNNFELHTVISSVLQIIMAHMHEIHNDEVIKSILQLLINHSGMTYFTNASQQHQLHRYQRYNANVFGSTGMTNVNTDLSQFMSNHHPNNNFSTSSLVTSRLGGTSQTVDHEVLLRSFIEHVLHHIQHTKATSNNNNNKSENENSENDEEKLLRVMHSEMELCELLTQAGKRSGELLRQTLRDRIVSWLTSFKPIQHSLQEEEKEELECTELSETSVNSDTNSKKKQTKSDNSEEMSRVNHELGLCTNHLSASDLMRIAWICEEATVMMDEVLMEAFLTQLRLLVNDKLYLYNSNIHKERQNALELSQVCSLLHFLHLVGKTHMLQAMKGVNCLLSYVIHTFADAEQNTFTTTEQTSRNAHLKNGQCKKNEELQQHRRLAGQWFNLHGLTLSELHILLRATIEESATPKHFTVLINSIALAVYNELSFIATNDTTESIQGVKNDHHNTENDNTNNKLDEDNNNKNTSIVNNDVEEFCKRLNLASTVELFVLFAKVFTHESECRKLSTRCDDDNDDDDAVSNDIDYIIRVLQVLSVVLYTQRSRLLQRHLLLEHVRRAMSGSTEALWIPINSSLYNLIVGKSLL